MRINTTVIMDRTHHTYEASCDDCAWYVRRGQITTMARNHASDNPGHNVTVTHTASTTYHVPLATRPTASDTDTQPNRPGF